MELQWWGYLHTNGSIQVKRYFEHLVLTEAQESDFVNRVIGPFNATSREDAISKVKEAL